MNTLERLQQYLLTAPVEGVSPGRVRRGTLSRIKCRDGESISVQAGEYLYSDPRQDEGPWWKVECGFPSAQPHPELMSYAEDKDKPLQTVYGYVPIEVVADFIDLHGGFAE